MQQPRSPQSQNFTDALSPLVPENHGWMGSISNYANYIRPYLTAKRISQGLCIAIGASAFVFYDELAEKCAAKETCGLWLSNLTTPTIAKYTFLIAGGGGYGATNAIQSKDGVNSAFEYVNNHVGAFRKAGFAALMLGVTGTQLGQNLIACLASNQPEWAFAVTMLAAIPTALYGTVLTLKNDIPKAAYKVSSMAHKFYINNLVCTPSQEQLEEIERVKYYDDAFTEFSHQVDANMQALINQAATIQIEEGQAPEKVLMQQEAAYQAPSFLDQAVHYSAVIGGVALGCAFSLPFAYGTLATLQNPEYSPYFGFIPDPTDYLIVGGTGLAVLYGNIHFTSMSLATAELFKDLLVGNPIKSLPVKLHPVMAPIVGAVCTGIAGMSFAAGHYFADTYYTGPQKLAMTFVTMAGISIFHWAGYWGLYPTLLAALSKNKTERFLYEVQDKANALKDDKAGFIEKLEKDPSFVELVKIQPFPIERPPVRTWGQALSDTCCFFRSKRHHELREDLAEVLVQENEHTAPSPRA